MCLLLVAHCCHPIYKLVLLFNRDEQYERPSLPLHAWDTQPKIFAGKDLLRGGSWLAIDEHGHWSAVTTIRQPGSQKSFPRSMGELPVHFLLAQTTIEKLSQSLISIKNNQIKPFNLMMNYGDVLAYYSHHQKQIHYLPQGIYALCNASLETPWPKVMKGKRMFQALIDQQKIISVEACFDLLADRENFPDKVLPNSGVGLEWERLLSSIFVSSPTYGTCSSTVILITHGGKGEIHEKSFASQNVSGAITSCYF